jgi:GWxTD domain-containing protein
MKKAVWGAALALVLLASLSCSRFPEPKNLDPESRDFFSKVRYIISKEERESFLRLPAADRPQFIKEFWERRDPTPGTPLNEFKEEYFQRIETATRLFKEGSTPGWLQDRGRVYITLGPPDNRETYPRGVDFYGKPTEIWWYGSFPIVFIDDNWSGNYQMTALGAQHIAEITRAQKAERQRGDGKSYQAPPSVDFDIAVEKADGRTVFAITVPYKVIWFKAEGDLFKTTLEAALSVKNAEGQTVWETKKSYALSATKAEGLELFEKNYEIRIEAEIPAGAYKLTVELSNTTGGGRSKRSLDIEI